jgi:uncharacterized protein (TIGR00251 family)
MNWLHPSQGFCTVAVKVTPRANGSEIVGAEPEFLRVRVKAPPVDGKANAELAALFAKRLGISKRAVEILSGDTSRLKRVRLHGVSAETLLKLLPETES